MELNEIKSHLNALNIVLDKNIPIELERLKRLAIVANNENLANDIWCIDQIYYIQTMYIDMFNNLKNKEHLKAWNLLEKIDIELSFLRDNFDYTGNKYNMLFIQCVIKYYEKLFPYHLFISRETIIKAESCSICGNPIKLRGGCKHKLGKLYMGELCIYNVTDWELVGTAIVENPFDKYGVIVVDNKSYNYSNLDKIMAQIESPFDYWYIEESKIKGQEYLNLGKNDKCPCKSGYKYKKCCMNTEKELTTYNRVTLLNGKEFKETPVEYHGTWIQ